MILTIEMADKILIFEIKNSHKSIRKRQFRKKKNNQRTIHMNRQSVKRKSENGQMVLQKMLKLTNSQDR